MKTSTQLTINAITAAHGVMVDDHTGNQITPTAVAVYVTGTNENVVALFDDAGVFSTNAISFTKEGVVHLTRNAVGPVIELGGKYETSFDFINDWNTNEEMNRFGGKFESVYFIF